MAVSKGLSKFMKGRDAGRRWADGRRLDSLLRLIDLRSAAPRPPGVRIERHDGWLPGQGLGTVGDRAFWILRPDVEKKPSESVGDFWEKTVGDREPDAPTILGWIDGATAHLMKPSPHPLLLTIGQSRRSHGDEEG